MPTSKDRCCGPSQDGRIQRVETANPGPKMRKVDHKRAGAAIPADDPDPGLPGCSSHRVSDRVEQSA